MSKIVNGTRPDWADDEDFEDTPAASLPAQQVIQNKDGTKTIITYRYNDLGQKVKVTRRIRTTIVKETVNPRIAERRQWAKFGLEKGKPPGPDLSTTTIGENIIFRPSLVWKQDAKDEGKAALEGEVKGLKDQLKDKKVKCRICGGEHYTMKCPFKDTMAPVEDGAPPVDGAADGEGLFGSGAAEAPTAGGKYVAPGKRGGGVGEKMGGRFGDRERDDMATLRITNVSDVTEEDELRQLFNRAAAPTSRVTRVFLAKDRETGRAKGFAFVSFDDREGAAKAMAAMDGYGLHHLILKVELARRSTDGK